MVIQIKAWLTKTLQGVVATILFFVGLDLLLRGVYVVRNAMVESIPLPYVVDDDYGPAPPWVDGLRMLAGPLQLGRSAPNTVAMYDDGTHGDERSGHGVWSYSAAFPRGVKISYVYTNSGAPGQWEGLDVPHIRTFLVPRDDEVRRIRAPIETFGTVYMQADSWHTNAAGYELIARAVRDAIADSLGPAASERRR